jgi:hypothetical protein
MFAGHHLDDWDQVGWIPKVCHQELFRTPQRDCHVADAVAGGGAGDDGVGWTVLLCLAVDLVLDVKVLKDSFHDPIGLRDCLDQAGCDSDPL